MRILVKLVRLVNAPIRFACDNVVGAEHGPKHRMIAGAAVMVLGVAIAKGGALIGIEFVSFTSDMFGYLVHGFGCMPFVETAISAINSNNGKGE